jgi:hypothetical protein
VLLSLQPVLVLLAPKVLLAQQVPLAPPALLALMAPRP